MAPDPAQFFVSDIVVHDVPRNDGSPADHVLALSDLAIPNLGNDHRNFFRERIAVSLRSHGFAVERDPDQPSRVPELVAAILADPDQLVPASQDIARALYAAQNRVNSPGLLIVVLGTFGQSPGVALLKLQRHEGLRMAIVDVDGQKTFSATVLNDLTLTDDTRVFKASLFSSAAPDRGADGLSGLVSDEQRGYDQGGDVANFFLRSFLGCRLETAPDVATRDFFDSTLEFIQHTGPEHQVSYTAALTAEMLRPADSITPEEFATRHFATEDRAPFLNHLQERGIQDAQITKDVHLVASRLKSVSVFTSRNVRVVGPPDVINDVVTFERNSDDEIIGIVIHDSVKRIRGG